MFRKKSKNNDEVTFVKADREQSGAPPESDDKQKQGKETALDKFQENGYDTGFVYFEE